MSHAPTIWEEGRAPGRRVVTLAVALALTFASLDLIFGARLGWFFDLGFVAICALVALMTHPRDFFNIAVLPPLLMLGLCLLLALTRRDSIAQADDSAVQAVVSGLGHHSIALGLGYACCLGALAMRRKVMEQRAAEERSMPYASERSSSLSA